MNRISVRGVGMAAAALAATSLTVGGFSASADQAATTPVVDASLINLNNSSNALSDHAETASLHSTAATVVLRIETRAALAKAAQAKAKAVAAHAARVRLAKAREARLAAIARANRAAVRITYSGSTRVLGQSLAAARGWTGLQFSCLNELWTHESGWRAGALNGSSGAYGIPQAQPGSKMASAGSDWRTNPATQIRWGLSYIASSYGSPCVAWSFWQAHHWY